VQPTDKNAAKTRIISRSNIPSAIIGISYDLVGSEEFKMVAATIGTTNISASR